jgi:acetoin:2,6-dichlorophenolindophenol oxidoreductase subunit alpha
MELTKERYIFMLDRMLKIRKFEERVKELFAAGELPGFVHLYLGQEAVATGVCAALNDEDYITSTHRGHGHILAKGGEMKYVMAELFGRASGYNKGKGGSMHIAWPKLGILGANGLVGMGIPIATGAAFSARYRKSNQVTACFFGDGAANEGTFHECLNLASAFNLPVIFVCENNLYGVGTRQSDLRKVNDIAERATAYGMPGIVVDGNDVLAVFEVTNEAVKLAKNGEGPSLIECKTYRWQTHFEGEPDTYRPSSEVQEWRSREPIAPYKSFLNEHEILSESEILEMEESISRELDQAVEFSRKSAFPNPADALEDLWA